MPEYKVSLSDRSPSGPVVRLSVIDDGPTVFFTRGKEESHTLELTDRQVRSIDGFEVEEVKKKSRSKPSTAEETSSGDKEE